MGRRRKHNKHLPKRVYMRGGGYYFVDQLGKWHRLGSTPSEMYRKYADFIDEQRPVQTMNDLFDRYELEVIPEKAPRTQKDNHYELRFLRAALGQMEPQASLPRHGYAYFNERKSKSLMRAVNEMALLSHAFTKAIEWGVIDANPCSNIRKQRPKPRQRYVTDQEYAAARSAMPTMLQSAMDLALLTGLRPGDLLRLQRENLTDDGIEVLTSKTGKRLIIEWSDELRAVVRHLLTLPPHIRQALICNRRGRAYTGDGFNSIWYRYMRKAVDDPRNPISEPFQFRDLRAKSASDDSRDAASTRLGHADTRTTDIYRRKVSRAKPLR